LSNYKLTPIPFPLHGTFKQRASLHQHQRQHPKRKFKRDHVFLESIQNGIFAMSRMPSTHTAVLVAITDGVVSFPNSSKLHAVLQALIRNDVACSFIQLGDLYGTF
jgi:hypothetical protein